MTRPATQKCSAVSRRFSPDMKLRWMPTVDGKIISGGAVPFSGFDTRREAVSAARAVADRRQSREERPTILIEDTPAGRCKESLWVTRGELREINLVRADRGNGPVIVRKMVPA